MSEIPAAVNRFIISSCKTAASACILIRYKRHKAVFRFIPFKRPPVIDNIYMKIPVIKNIALTNIFAYPGMIFKKEFFSPERAYNNSYIHLLYILILRNKLSAIKAPVISFKRKIRIIILSRKHIRKLKRENALIIKVGIFTQDTFFTVSRNAIHLNGKTSANTYL